MEDFAQRSLREIITEDFRRAEVLDQYHLDYCCSGEQSLREACEASALDFSQVAAQLAQLPCQYGGLVDVSYLDATQLCDYIERRHHQYIRKNIPLLVAYLDNVVTNHHRQHPELATVRSLFNNLAQELMEQIEREETLLFPLIRQLHEFRQESDELAEAPLAFRADELFQEITDDHRSVYLKLQEIAMISNYFQPPADAALTYREMLRRLKHFEHDFQLHSHLEHNVLFPKIDQLLDANPPRD